jgi:hypothetical protein
MSLGCIDLALPPLSSPLYPKFHYSLFGDGAGYRWVAFLAIALSIAGTSLTGIKQIYDPTRTLTQNARALLELRQLHQEVINGIQCQEGGVASSEKMPQWAWAIRRIRGVTIPAYGAYVNFDVSTTSQRTDSAPPPLTPALPPTAPGTTASAAN